ncbi:aspartyl/glutamyl-tRNA amidotransferase subunit A [Ammoniphilus oxalaticus]|uniref:Glutamyl-tRNA(Gln) amidotransferase subunit A n=1 Tax=Ammoniphilus oxalaticus TaxID=66863 RepID=A0A419SD74_9BACL|nr:Asp-tRNA(Asn)/Glu-tRNA(Gln) amidotransferase subunit GatA [Ammoniphilus oxalaticus]RKD21072.1 aspartyl/glutamyl-tRNA amidotransferase subunit A [Ammoniphilus oxalaticus]
MSIFDKKITELHNALEQKQVSVSELIDASFQRIKQTDDQLKAFLTLNEEQAKQKAKQLDEQGSLQGERGLLFGLPIAVKDNIVTEHVTTTAGSKMLENYDPIYNATVMDRICASESILIGKTNMDEFGMGGSTENSAFQVTVNPWNKEYVPGGSSGGSAAAVAARQAFFALGSDTGGSIRQPAAYCGVVGLKPTYGLVSRFGLISYASSLDTIGPITKNVEDAAYLLSVLAAHDPYDSTSADVDVPDYISALNGNVKGLKVGVPKELLGEGVDQEIKDKIQQALKTLEGMGAIVEEVSLPHTEYAVPTYYILGPSEASSNLARYDGVRFGMRSESGNDLIQMYKETRSQGFGAEVKRRIMLGTYALSSGYYDAYYKKAQQVRTLIKQDFDELFANYDVLIGPTTPTTAYKIGEKVADPLKMYLNDICTAPVNLAGIPAISVPCGLTNDGLPVGLQIMGKHFDESTVLRVAHAFEQQTDHHSARPQL